MHVKLSVGGAISSEFESTGTEESFKDEFSRVEQREGAGKLWSEIWTLAFKQPPVLIWDVGVMVWVVGVKKEGARI